MGFQPVVRTRELRAADPSSSRRGRGRRGLGRTRSRPRQRGVIAKRRRGQRCGTLGGEGVARPSPRLQSGRALDRTNRTKRPSLKLTIQRLPPPPHRIPNKRNRSTAMPEAMGSHTRNTSVAMMRRRSHRPPIAARESTPAARPALRAPRCSAFAKDHPKEPAPADRRCRPPPRPSAAGPAQDRPAGPRRSPRTASGVARSRQASATEWARGSIGRTPEHRARTVGSTLEDQTAGLHSLRRVPFVKILVALERHGHARPCLAAANYPPSRCCERHRTISAMPAQNAALNANCSVIPTRVHGSVTRFKRVSVGRLG